MFHISFKQFYAIADAEMTGKIGESVLSQLRTHFRICAQLRGAGRKLRSIARRAPKAAVRFGNQLVYIAGRVGCGQNGQGKIHIGKDSGRKVWNGKPAV